jgi:hypothetical protein
LYIGTPLISPAAAPLRAMTNQVLIPEGIAMRTSCMNGETVLQI